MRMPADVQTLIKSLVFSQCDTSFDFSNSTSSLCFSRSVDKLPPNRLMSWLLGLLLPRLTHKCHSLVAVDSYKRWLFNTCPAL